jgi:hypothetical protein
MMTSYLLLLLRISPIPLECRLSVLHSCVVLWISRLPDMGTMVRSQSQSGRRMIQTLATLLRHPRVNLRRERPRERKNFRVWYQDNIGLSIPQTRLGTLAFCAPTPQHLTQPRSTISISTDLPVDLACCDSTRSHRRRVNGERKQMDLERLLSEALRGLLILHLN